MFNFVEIRGKTFRKPIHPKTMARRRTEKKVNISTIDRKRLYTVSEAARILGVKSLIFLLLLRPRRAVPQTYAREWHDTAERKRHHRDYSPARSQGAIIPVSSRDTTVRGAERRRLRRGQWRVAMPGCVCRPCRRVSEHSGSLRLPEIRHHCRAKMSG